MTGETWLDVIARLSAEEPVDLDPILADPSPRPEAGAAGAGNGPTIRSAKLWKRDDTVSHIGIRVERIPDDPRRLALRLASAAAERGVVPIILSTLPRTGLEQYGLRVERLPDGSPESAARAEAELRKFWDMPIVVSLSDAERLG